jgi:type VI secretion system secreted protein VgrG
MDSNAGFVQTQRFLKIDTPLGDSALLLTGIEASEAMSSPFLLNVTFCTNFADSKILGLLGKPATLSIGNGAEAPRLFNGLFRKLSGPAALYRGYFTWRAEIVPQMAFMAYTSDCRIFQNKTVVQIITRVLDIHGIQNYEFRSVMGDYPVLDYCVQYRESALNFISRLMEHFGIYYWFEHDETSHKLVITDSAIAAKPMQPDLFTMPDQDQNASITSLEAEYAFRPGAWTLKDYDFVNPDSPMLASTPTVITGAPLTDYEIFEFPGSFDDAGAGSNISRVRIEQEESQYHRMRGTGTARDVSPGRQITIAVPDGAGGHDDTTLLLVAALHHAADMTQVVPDADAGTYANEFTGVPTTYNYRPTRVAQKPFVQGVQTARVTGPPGQKIFTDNHGRVKVRFHWDRNPDGDADDSSSCWMRVSQIWSSGIGGGIQVPRVGEEVIVDFLEGDPDRPIITGRVYNGNNTTPYGLPGNQTQFGFKTQSIPAGGFHELRFEDKAGSEEIYIKSQKDYNRDVLNNETDNIGGNVVRKVTGNVDHTTNGNHSKTVAQNDKRTVNGTVTHQFTGNVETTHMSNTTHVTGLNHSMTVGVAMSEQGPSKTSTWQSVLQNISDHTTNAIYSLTFTGIAFSLIGENIQVIPSGNLVGGQNMQAYAMNQQFCFFNQQINGIDVSFNLLVNKNIAAKYQTTAQNFLTALNHCHIGASIVKTFGVEVNT